MQKVDEKMSVSSSQFWKSTKRSCIHLSVMLGSDCCCRDERERLPAHHVIVNFSCHFIYQ